MDENITEEPIEAHVNTSSIESLLQQSNTKLQAIGQSIDFLAAVMTGLDPDQIAIAGEIDPTSFKSAANMPALSAPSKVDEKMINISTALLEEIIEEAIIEEIKGAKQ
jgi:hypothetical protein|tara:strand:- start:311 stop:634 length:324 start_codon:yes stop_codon:yes gene_type:complete